MLHGCYVARFKKIRNKLNHFSSANLADLKVATLESIDEAVKQEFIALFDKWAKNTKQTNEDMVTLRLAFVRLIAVADSIPLLYTTVRKQSHLIALHISEALENKYAICHFEKALPIYENLTAFVAHEGANALIEHGLKYANWEQDLGMEGLRQAKSKWQPSKFLKKYSIQKSLLQ